MKFLTFPAEILRTSYNTLDLALKEIKNPETRAIGIKRLSGALVMAGATGAASIGSAALLSGYDDDDKKAFENYLPPWSKNSDIIYLTNKGNGVFTYIDLGFSDPYNYIKKPINQAIRSAFRDNNFSNNHTFQQSNTTYSFPGYLF